MSRNTNTTCSAFSVYILSFLTILIAIPFSQAITCNSHDLKVLLQIRQSLGNPRSLAGWDPNGDCCNWEDNIECNDSTGRVITLMITDDDQAVGQIPTVIANLPYLETLTLSNLPNLTGTIPSVLVKLTNLRQIQFANLPNITGPVPSFLGQMKNLTTIDLAVGRLSGSIPPSIGLLPKLNIIDLEFNQLTGPIPETFGSFQSQPFRLILSRNNLSGQIPKSLANVQFTQLDLFGNQFTGDVSYLINKDSKIVSIDLSTNRLSFNMSEVVNFAPNLTQLDLSHNMIYGSLSAGLAKLDLDVFDVSYNMLCGKIPTGGKLGNFGNSSYVHNKCLCGTPLPPCNGASN